MVASMERETQTITEETRRIDDADQLSPTWQPTTKALIGLAMLVLAGAVLIRFRSVLSLLILAGILAFIMTPLVRIINRRARLSWLMATNISYLFLVLLILLLSTASGLAVVQQLQALFQVTQGFLAGVPEVITEYSQRSYAFGPWSFDFSQYDISTLTEQVLGYVQPLLGQASMLITGLASVAAETLARTLFVIVVGYFLTLDNERVRMAWSRLTIPGYENDVQRMRGAIGNIWNAFLRGQLLVVGVWGLLTWVLLSILNVRYALALSVLGAFSKFIPIVGPTSAGVLAAIIGLFQSGNWFGLPSFSYAILIAMCVLILDQSIDYLLVPRIMGSSLNLHPVLILVGAIMGATLFGILGLLLSAPLMATFILLGRYVFRKMVDQSPWEPAIDARPEYKTPPVVRLAQHSLERLRSKIFKRSR